MKEEELPLSHKNNGDIINNDDTDLSLLPSVPPGPRNSKKEKRSRKKGKRKGTRGRRERNGDGVSKGEWWVWIGWPNWVM